MRYKAGGKQKLRFSTYVKVFELYNRCNKSHGRIGMGGNVVRTWLCFFIVFSDFPIINMYIDFIIRKAVRVMFNF